MLSICDLAEEFLRRTCRFLYLSLYPPVINLPFLLLCLQSHPFRSWKPFHSGHNKTCTAWWRTLLKYTKPPRRTLFGFLFFLLWGIKCHVPEVTYDVCAAAEVQKLKDLLRKQNELHPAPGLLFLRLAFVHVSCTARRSMCVQAVRRTLCTRVVCVSVWHVLWEPLADGALRLRVWGS